MTILNARSRLVSFRLTQEELEDLRVSCLLKGARNVSEFARNAVLQQAETGTSREAQLLDRFASVETRLSSLEQLLKGTVDTQQGNAEMLRVVLKILLNRLSEREPIAAETQGPAAEEVRSHDPHSTSEQAHEQAQGA